MEMGEEMREKEKVKFLRKKKGNILKKGRENWGIINIEDIGIKDRILGEINKRVFEKRKEIWEDRMK